MNAKPLAALTALAISLAGSSTSWAQAGAHVTVDPAELEWVDVPALPPGAKIALIEGPRAGAVPFMFRLKFPANYRIPPHSHPVIEHLTVLSGSVYLGMGDKLDEAQTRPLAAGSVAIIPPAANHFAWTKEEAVVQVHGVGPWSITYLNPADDPRNK